ncbi:transporter substrate-binding domain-containing protein [Pseudomonas sp. DTU_2021_1001937_2_SI_NGA_ILE_001]|uniref:substrate-binding periplasmic protein n=1 Tax=Pseudomonas sp. DTU_2021_1001937_2_SI_NGA_ILE_001 TaxID=3077589 RepID=UPI0028FC2D73|nr:transporter substrate-binding domain-containing protein [Pseudomonas sp. DTU_2021_1001937_2_SI_NGA_ILE_001]WNW12573.1 transporter substrate-binding domain-containing protein [Pseudomonas sp. DTU_2021_1001937_2_SI_NGA_ILE_001]
MGFRALIAACTLACLPGFATAQAWLAGGSEWHPFSYSDAQQQMQGIAVDIVREVLAQAGIQARFVSYPANRMQVMLERGQLDLSYAESRAWQNYEVADQYVFSEPYMKVREYLFFARNNPAADKPIDALQNLTIGMVRGYTYKRLDAAFASQRLMKLETSQDIALFDLLDTGRVDAVAMVDDLYTYLTATHHIDPSRFRRGAQLSEAPLSIMLQRKHAERLPAIDQAIRRMQDSGEIARILDAHMPTRTAVACNTQDPAC